MKCPACLRNKGIQLTCRECHRNFCTGCIQLEVHACPCIKTKVVFEKERLEKQLVKVEAPKIIKI
jgi:hypothetical protein